MKPLTLSALALDKDGVTFDSERLYAESLQMTLTDWHLPPSPTVAAQCCGLTAEKTAALLRQHLGDTVDLEKFYSHWFANRDALIAQRGVPFMPDADKLIEQLYAAGYPLALVTSDNLDNVIADFQRSPKPHLMQHFAVIITVDDVAEPKPAPEPYLRAAAYLGVDNAQMLVVEDSDYGAQAAIAAGSPTLILQGAHPPAPETARAAQQVIANHQQTWDFFDEYRA